MSPKLTAFLLSWEPARADRVVVIAHGYGEHIGRCEHVAAAVAARGARRRRLRGPITSHRGPSPTASAC